ncbi:hypothetical protein G6F57_007684 [Rhizopus arrhizus]|uniref:Nudix hydrolase domain-containing protein n=1 Tax=Rhizopus oryzae TaxID=64495 RepID=A0A9P6X1R4_RHIOR|nr:hypothetical protein G6F21_002973 [Rhizopus arrhizus]KAG0806863.1 hypothetical protein G6F20_010793 [Rhizopus arrhizus]KAG0823390.1 hypothetical protein G6F19_010880 [Rhizopus arrhizus]KAG0824515.1 hypothetical protein G6F18_010842 [Rhizopus arrhizus]KAG0852092.1 hypothetical protein G6F17_008414 [Rhizopus arrhizus]
MIQNQLIDSLSERLEKDVQIFDNLLKLIPTKFYVMDKSEQIGDSKFQHNKRKKAPKQAIKEATKKAKKAKLDPENAKTVMDVQEEKAQQLKDEEEKKRSEEEEGEEGESMEIDSNGFSGLDDGESIATESTATSTQESVQLQPMEKSDIDQLRNRLHERINQLRQKRNAPGANATNPRSRDDILAARNKKKEDRKKAIKAQKEKGSKAPQEELIQIDKKTSNTNNKQRSADSIKMDGDVFFGKLSVGKEQQKKKKGPTDAKTQLKLVEAKKEKLEKLKHDDKSKAQELLEKEEWNKVLSLATGEKLKDDPKLLKKTIKRQEKQKTKSAQEWRKRTDKQKMDEKKAIKKREENIKAKIEEKKLKKKGIKAKPNKKKARPGFEGGKRSKGVKATVHIANQSVPICSLYSQEEVNKSLSFQPFKDWLVAFNKQEESRQNEFDIKSIDIQNIDYFGDKIGFVKFKANVQYKETGKSAPGIVFMAKDQPDKVILTLQPRIPVPHFAFPELPAGMLDGSGNFTGTAAKEIEEETGLVIKEEELVDMTELAYGDQWRGVYTSAGGSDEFLRLFTCIKHMKKSEIDELEGKLTGLRDHGESITLKLVSFEDAWKASPDAKLLSSLALYQALKDKVDKLK